MNSTKKPFTTLSHAEQDHLMKTVCKAIIKRAALGPTPPYQEHVMSWLGMGQTLAYFNKYMESDQAFWESSEENKRMFFLLLSEVI
jgi:hypothetical protein